MKILEILFILIPATILLYLFALLPQIGRRKRYKAFQGLHFAHRGLWSIRKGIPENSLPAFQAAADKGYAIELDVHLTADGKAVVFHDDGLQRMCESKSMIWDISYEDLQKLYLKNSKEKVPLFSDVLQVVKGRVPLLVELKANGTSTKVCEVASHLLDNYPGLYCIESFSPFILRWYKKNRPQIIRGQLSCHFQPSVAYPWIAKKMSEHLFVNFFGRPDFIAYEYHHGMHLWNILLLKKLFQTPIFAWTIHSQTAEKNSKKVFDSIIFDRYLP